MARSVALTLSLTNWRALVVPGSIDLAASASSVTYAPESRSGHTKAHHGSPSLHPETCTSRSLALTMTHCHAAFYITQTQ